MQLINPTLMSLAQHRVWQEAAMEKIAVVPPGMDPAAMGGAPPPGMDPAAMGGAPPPGMDPAAMGGAPPPGMDPAAMGGAPPPMAPPPGGAPMGQPPMPGAAPPMMNDPAQAAAMGQPAPKLKPEQMMQMLDFRLYNMQMQLTALMNAMNVTLPPGALVTPPGSPTPVAESAVPGGPQDPSAGAGGGAGGGGGGGGGGAGGGASAISPIGPIQGASPEMAGGEKTGSDNLSISGFIEKIAGSTATDVYSVGSPYQDWSRQSPATNAAAVAAMLRQRTQGTA